jgi:hypothetical protein
MVTLESPVIRHPFVSLLMSIGGLLLMLLPAGCALHFIGAVGLRPKSAGSQWTAEFWYILWFISFAISALGVYMIGKVVRDV